MICQKNVSADVRKNFENVRQTVRRYVRKNVRRYARQNVRRYARNVIKFCEEEREKIFL